jgi:hypothetical protein
MTKKKVAKAPWQARQGDVFIEAVPASAVTEAHKPVAKDRRGIVLAEGEATGHHHRIQAPEVCLLQAEGIHERVMTVGAASMLVHEEHAAIEIPAGTFVVSQQVEYDWFAEASRVVAD